MATANQRARGRWFSRYFCDEIVQVLRSVILDDDSILEIGTQHAGIADCRPGTASIALSIAQFAGAAPTGNWDAILLNGAVDQCRDVSELLDTTQRWCSPKTRLIIVSYSRVWQPAVRAATRLGLRECHPEENWIPSAEIDNLLEQCGFERVSRRGAMLIPFRIPLISRAVNRFLAPLPLLRALTVGQITVARPIERNLPDRIPSLSVLIPARNEAGNISAALERLPRLSPVQEVIFVEGNSTDDTWDTICSIAPRVSEFPSVDSIVHLQQPGRGKGDAVRAGFSVATGDVLCILDGDLTMPPEELGKYFRAICDGTCEFANGSRLVYPMENESMQFLNLIANRLFGILFSFLLGQPVRDTLCGTKMLRRSEYERIAANRSYFGELDPFGDFDLLFGAARMSLRIRDIPIHYRQRTYGSTNISRFSHGVLLIKMCALAARRIRFV